MSTRSTLKGYFKKGAIPTEGQFADLIDSTLNLEDDPILKSSGGPLSVKANGTDENLINFYRIEQDGNKLTWQIKQKPSGKTGLSIETGEGTSRLFIDGATGRLGVGTTSPQSPLAVAGGVSIGATYAGANAAPVNGLVVEGVVAIGAADSAAGRLSILESNGTQHGPSNGTVVIDHDNPGGASSIVFRSKINRGSDYGFIQYQDDSKIGGTGESARLLIGTMNDADDHLILLPSGNVGIGNINPGEKLEVNGNLKVSGACLVSGSIYAGGIPLAFENYEIYLRGSAFESPEGNITFLKIANISMGMSALRGLNTVILNPNGTPKNRAINFDVYLDPSKWNDWADWVNANASDGDIVAVASYDALQNAPRGGSAETLLNAVMALEAFNAVKSSVRSPYALIFAKGGIAIEVSNTHGGPNAHLKTTYYHLIAQDRSARRILKSPSRFRMYPDTPLVYQEIFDAKKAGAISKLGNPAYDETTYVTTLWNDRHLIKFGGNNEADGNGAIVTIPPGYDTVWVRVLGDRWAVMKAYFLDGAQEQLGLWIGGWRSTNCYCPDGSLTDGYSAVHQWVPIPAGRAGKLALIPKPYTGSEFWISGLAFSRNPWAHATQASVGYYWASNGGNPTSWSDGWHNWNNDILSRIDPKTRAELRVPVLPNGRDKLLYLVEHNNNWNGAMHSGITVNNVAIERFMASYDNPFARHFSSKFYNRYIAARIPASVVGKARFLSVIVDMSKQDLGIHFREMGTHDFEIPWG